MSEDSKFFAIRTTGGQEHVVARLVENRLAKRNPGLYSILVLENLKGYIVVEAASANIAYEVLSGIKHVRGQIKGEISLDDIKGFLVKKPSVEELSVDDTVEIIGGPFKGMKAKITRVDYDRQEATVILLDAPYQLPVTIDANYLRLVQKA
ncbi:MAG: transcription elongation factor Spt5 [Candidatus Nitrosocaldaceae archaeon]|nr:MAG: transcription elongation factor Spt5 [Candidatus Nitrosocaldaceae archaeon]